MVDGAHGFHMIGTQFRAQAVIEQNADTATIHALPTGGGVAVAAARGL